MSRWSATRVAKARASAAQAQEQIQSAVSNLGTNSSMAAFEQMEEKVLAMEASSQAMAELAGADLESQFASLEGGNDVDDELAALKTRLEGGATPIALPADNGPVPQLEPVKVAEVDAELEELRHAQAVASRAGADRVHEEPPPRRGEAPAREPTAPSAGGRAAGWVRRRPGLLQGVQDAFWARPRLLCLGEMT